MDHRSAAARLDCLEVEAVRGGGGRVPGVLLLSRFSRRCAHADRPCGSVAELLRDVDRRSAAARLDCLEVAAVNFIGSRGVASTVILGSYPTSASFDGVSGNTPALDRGEFNRRGRDEESAQNRRASRLAVFSSVIVVSTLRYGAIFRSAAGDIDAESP